MLGGEGETACRSVESLSQCRLEGRRARTTLVSELVSE